MDGPKYIQQKLAHIHNSQHNQNFFDHAQTYAAIYYGHSELFREEKSKFESEEKKVQFITESCVFKAETPKNLPLQE